MSKVLLFKIVALVCIVKILTHPGHDNYNQYNIPSDDIALTGETKDIDYIMNKSSHASSEEKQILITSIEDENLETLLKSADTFFVISYEAKDDTDININKLKDTIQQIADILKKSKVTEVFSLFMLNTIAKPSIKFIIGDLNESNFKITFFKNKALSHYYSSSMSFDDISTWIFDKYPNESKAIIYESIKKQVETINDEECKENPLNIIKGGIDSLEKQAHLLEARLNNYKEKLTNSKIDYDKIKDEMRPLRVFTFIIVIVILVAIVLVFKRIKIKKAISIV